MGMISSLLKMLFGGDRNVIQQTAEVFRENAEAAAQRGADLDAATLNQFAAEFRHSRRGWFDRFVDGLNRLPRPALAFGTIALFVSAMASPLWFAERMQGLALVPEPLWWLMGAIISFYFGARHQAKTQEFQEQIATTIAAAPKVMENIKAIRAMRHDSPGAAATTDASASLAAVGAAADENPPLALILKRKG